VLVRILPGCLTLASGQPSVSLSRACPGARFCLCDLGVLGGQFAFLYVDLRLRDLRATTYSGVYFLQTLLH